MIYYTIYENQIALFIEGTPYSIPAEDGRFGKIATLLQKEDFEAVRELVELERLFEGNSEVKYNSGVVFYQDEQISSSLSELIINAAQEGKNYEHYLKFHTALKYNQDFLKSPHKRKLFYKNFKDIYLLGDTVIYDASEKLPIDNFYSLDSFPDFFMQEIIKAKDVRKALEEIAGFKSEKLVKLFRSEVLESKETRASFLDFLLFSKKLLDPHTVYSFWEKHKGKYSFKHARNLNQFLKKYKSSEKGVINFIENSKDEDLRHLGELLAQEHNGDEMKLPEFSSAKEIIPIVKKEISRLNGQMFFLNQEEHFPALNELELSLGELSLVIPQTNEDLEEWSYLLSNCIRGYAQSAKKGQTLLLGVKKAGTLVYALEIVGRNLRQFSSKYNGAVPRADREKVVKHLKENSFLK